LDRDVPERAVDHPGGLVERRIADVVLAKVELDVGGGRVRAGLGEHRGRRVDADHPPSGRLGDRDRHATVADGELHDRSVSLARQPEVGGDVMCADHTS
jgi:hypothetical protein